MTRIKLELPLDDTSKIKETWSLEEKTDKVYEIKKQLKANLGDVILVNIIDEVPLWVSKIKGYVVLNVTTNEVFTFELSREQEMSIYWQGDVSDIKQALTTKCDVESILTKGLDGLLEIFECEDREELITYLFNRDVDFEFTELVKYFSTQDKEVVHSVLSPIIQDFKSILEQRMEKGDKKDELAEVVDAIGMLSLFLVKITPNLVEETKEYMKVIIQKLFKLEEFEESIYVTNAMCLFLQRADKYLEVENSKYEYYSDIIPEPPY
ncbi:hypothetical protein ACQUY5_27085 [Bacillus cereus]|uniref:hypothetical protein n=1 Tax=Bacillus cereus TaxID=1396 RepID=UPI003D173963